MRRNISLGSAAEENYAFSRGVVVGNTCYLAGITGADQTTSILPESLAEQAENCFGIIDVVLEKAGFSISGAVRVVYYISEPEFAGELGPILRQKFEKIRPAATMIVAAFPSPAVKIEIEVTAVRDI